LFPGDSRPAVTRASLPEYDEVNTRPAATAAGKGALPAVSVMVAIS